MGDPGKPRKKYSRPRHPWKKERIDEENKLVEDYGLKNKKEIWRMRATLKKFTGQAKKLATIRNKQDEKEKAQLLARVERLGLVKQGANLETVLGLNVNDILQRRLQTILFKKGLAKTLKQSRQFITHKKVYVGAKKITVPSYMVLKEEEHIITISPEMEKIQAEEQIKK